MLYLLAAGAIFLFIICIVLNYKFTKLKVELGLISQNYLQIQTENESLRRDKLNNIAQIAKLESQIQYINRLSADQDKAKKESFDSAKAALFELGNELSKQLISIHKQETDEVRKLSEQNITKTSEKFSGEFERLINMVSNLNQDIQQSKNSVDVIKQSLLSPAGAGKLAEITLENILKASGLRVNIDFMLQYNVTSADNAKFRPDAVIFLPGGNIMVIDAKASKFLLDEQEPDNLSKTMNLHLKSLSNKEYVAHMLENLKNNNVQFANIITLMFLPTEHAVEKILESDPSFLQKAWGTNIFPVGPSGLMNMLSFAKFQISDYMRSENHKLIIEEVRKLLLSASSISEYSQKLGSNIQSIVATYDKFAGSFNRNFLSRAKNIQKLGIEIGNKNIPSALQRYELVSSKSELIEAEVQEVQLPQSAESLPISLAEVPDEN